MDAAGPSDRRKMPIRYFTVGDYAIFGKGDSGTFGTLATFLPAPRVGPAPRKRQAHDFTSP